MPKLSNGFLPDYESLDEATWKRLSVVYLCSPANPQGAIASKDYLQKLLLSSAASTTPCWRFDECYAEIYTGAPPPGAPEAALEIDETGLQGPVPQSRGVPLAVEALERRRPALGLHGGRPQAGGDGAALAHLWRPADSFAVQKASAALWREETHPFRDA